MDNGESVKDLTTGYIWDRCFVGQTWSDAQGGCIDKPTRMTLSQAKSLANSEGKAVPSLYAIAKLSYCSSGKPSYFPNTTPANNYRCEDVDQAIHPVFRVINYVTPEVHVTTQCSSNTWYGFDFVEGRAWLCAGSSSDVNVRLYRHSPASSG